MPLHKVKPKMNSQLDSARSFMIGGPLIELQMIRRRTAADELLDQIISLSHMLQLYDKVQRFFPIVCECQVSPSMPRLPELFEKEQLPAGQQDVYDYLIKARGKISNGYAPLLHCP